jgi:phosphatidylglycerophosphate synthase
VSAPIREAVVETTADAAARTVAGVPLLLRTVLVLQKAGVESVVVEGPADVPRDPRLRIPVGRTHATTGRHLVVGAGSVIDVRLVQAAVSSVEPVRWERDGARVEVRPVVPWPPTPPARGTLLPATAPRGVVEQALLLGLENPRDGYLDRWLNRHLSRPLTRVLLRTPLMPNHVTLAGVLIGIWGGLLLGSPTIAGVLGGVAALVLSGVLDCCDGEIARIRFAESRIGHLLDVVGDTLVHGALLAGIAMQLARTGDWPGTGTLVALGLGIAGAFAAITWSEQTEARRHRAGDAWENRVLEGVLSPLTTRDWYVFPVLFALAGRLDALVAAAAWGAHVFWAAVAVLVWRVLRRGAGQSSSR